MRSRYAQFQCNKCTFYFSNHVLIAESPNEFDQLKKAIFPPFAEFSNDQLVKQFSCPQTGCSGKVNVVIGEKAP